VGGRFELKLAARLEVQKQKMAAHSDLGLCTPVQRLGQLLPVVRFDLPLSCARAEEAVVHLGGVKRTARAVYGHEELETTAPTLFVRPHDVECAPAGGALVEAVPAFVLSVEPASSQSDGSSALLTGLVQRHWCFPRLIDFRFLHRESSSLPLPVDAGSMAAGDNYIKFRGGPVLHDRDDISEELIQNEHQYEQWCPPRWFCGEFGDFTPPRSLCKQRLPLTYK